MVLTFIGERFVEAWEAHNAAGDCCRGYGGRLAPLWWVAVTDTTLEKRWYNRDEEAYGTVTKTYYWGDAEHSTLYVACWSCDEHGPQFTRLVRVANTMPGLSGTWTFFDRYADELRSLSIDGDTVTFSVVGGGDGSTLTGTGTLDPATYFLDLTGAVWDDGVLAGIAGDISSPAPFKAWRCAPSGAWRSLGSRCMGT